MTDAPPRRRGRPARFFFMHLSGLVVIISYFVLYGASGYSAEGLRRALLIALVAQTGYLALAWSQDELKQFDIGLWVMFAIGAFGVVAGIAPLSALYRYYSPAILFLTLALTAILPPLFGCEWFTTYFVRRTVPRWQQRMPVAWRIARLTAALWIAIFLIASALCFYAPLDWRYNTLYPNLLIVAVGVTAQWWLPAVYLRLFPADAPSSAEGLIMSMPFVFDPRAANGISAQIQFRVSGGEPGDYWVRIARGRCQSFEGEAPAPDLVVHTPDTLWTRIMRGEIDGTQALADGLYRADGDVAMLASIGRWFGGRR